MRPRADRDGKPPADPAAYWRRRFLILGGGLAMFAVLAWQFTRAHPAPAAGAAARSSDAALQTQGALPSAAYGSPWASPSPTDGSCTAADIVLSLFTSQTSYRRGAQPRFDVYAVSTAASSCRLLP